MATNFIQLCIYFGVHFTRLHLSIEHKVTNKDNEKTPFFGNGTLSIKLATLFATGLLSTTPSKISTTTTFTKVTTFNNSYGNDPGQTRNTDIMPLLSTYINNQFNTSPPLGSNLNHAFEVFNDGNMANSKKPCMEIGNVLTIPGLGSPYAFNQSYQATADVLITDLACEEATATAALVNQTTIGTVLTLQSQSCSINIRLDAVAVTTAIIPPLDECAAQSTVYSCTDKLKSQATEIESSTQLSIGLGGWPFQDANWKVSWKSQTTCSA